MKVLATYNIKGGVGKTSTAVNLAYLAAREGRRTLLWDLDLLPADFSYCNMDLELDDTKSRVVPPRRSSRTT